MNEDIPDSIKAKALDAAGYLASHQGDTGPAETYLRGALHLWRGLGDERGIARALISLGVNAKSRNEYSRAEALWNEAVEVARGAADTVEVYWALHQLAQSALRHGDSERAQALIHEGLVLKRQQEDAFGLATSLFELGQLAWQRGEYERALALARESLILSRDIGHVRHIAMNLQLLVHVTADRGQAEQSVRLFGAVERLQASLGDARSAAVVLNIDPYRTDASLAACRARLTPAAFEAGWAAGKTMTTEEAVTFALDAAASDQWIETGDDVDNTGLTRRESEVLHLIADGNSNQQIATDLVLSLRTVERHIANLYAKLGARNRAEAVAYAVRHGLT